MAPSKLPPKAGDDYTVLPLTIPPTAAFPRPATHILYLRPHAPKLADADTPRALFAVNLPVDATEPALRALFAEQLGGARIERVEMEGGLGGRKGARGVAAGSVGGTGTGTAKAGGRKRKRGGEGASENEGEGEGLPLPRSWERELLPSGAGAVLVFVDRASAEMAMKEVVRAARKRVEITWKSESGLGLQRYHTHHRNLYPTPRALQTSTNAYLTQYATHEAARAKALARARSIPDADGFITVTRGGRAGPARLEEAQAAAQKLKARQSAAAPEDFYRFQTREKKKAGAEKLKRDFLEDRRRVERMRARRGKTLPES